jgi:hypothetical protein
MKAWNFLARFSNRELFKRDSTDGIGLGNKIVLTVLGIGPINNALLRGWRSPASLAVCCSLWSVDILILYGLFHSGVEVIYT